MRIDSGFGANVSPHNWEVSSQSRCRLAEHLKSSRELPKILHKHSDIVDLIKLPKDTDKHSHLMVQATTNSVNVGVQETGN